MLAKILPRMARITRICSELKNFESVKSVPLKGKITQFREDSCRKGTQRTDRQELMLFFFVIFAFSCGQFNLVAAGRAGRFAPFCGKIISSDYP